MNIQSPYLHPRWDDQVALEMEMLEEGKKAALRRLNKAREKGNMGNLRPHRSLLREWVKPVADTIQSWVLEFSAKGKRGPRPISLPLIERMDHETLAVIALRSVLRMLGVERRGLMGIANEIGTWVEHESRALEWQEQDPESWDAMTGAYASRGSNEAHMRRSRIAIFNKYISDKIMWRYWTQEERTRVGLTLIDCVVRGTKRFHLANDPEHVYQKGGKKVKSPQIVLEADEGLSAWLKGALEDEEVMWPSFMPTLIPPKPWTGPRDGGYWTPFVRTPFLIRFKASHEEQRMKAIEEYEAIDMPLVYSALNHIQNTAWAINKKVLDVVERVWKMDIAIGGLPRQEEETRMVRPENWAEMEDDEKREWNREASAIRTRNAKMLSKIISADSTIKAARRMLDEPCFYFPHMLDFRGRCYPIPSALQPQGNDLHRGLLTFHEAKAVTAEDAGWLAIQLANCMGVDKVSFDDRIAWVEENEDAWRSIAENPLGDRRWTEWEGKPIKDCWQSLAAIFEWVRWLDTGEGMLSSLPVRIDGTCNGIQHLSAMVRDEHGGASVNLLPSDKPRDIYGEVAGILEKRLRDLGVGYPQEWLHFTDNKIPRDLTKRPVMILPYGGTRHAYWGYTMEWLRKQDPHDTIWDKDIKVERTTQLIPLLWEAVQNSPVGNAMNTMRWLQDCAGIASKTGRPLYWKTPSGFVVRQFYALEEKQQIKVEIDGTRVDLVHMRETKELDTKAQHKGIAPNFVHSMDASAMTTTMNYCTLQGINSVTVIHDSYGTVAADMHTLAALIRRAFVWTYQHEVLKDFQTACMSVSRGLKDVSWPDLPKFGKLDIEQVEQADYFFA